MLLSEAAATTVVAAWEGSSIAGWTPAETQTLVEAVRSAADAVVPRIVDNTLSDDDVQRFAISRLEHATDSWLAAPAARLRRALRIDRTRLNAVGNPQLGLRSATIDEIDGLAGIGPDRAEAIARMVNAHPDLASIGQLDVLDGIGQATVKTLQSNAYLDRPAVAFGSGSLAAFAMSPTMTTLIRVFDTSDVEIGLGDGTSWQRRGFAGGSTPVRLGRMFDDIAARKQKTLSPTMIPTGEFAERWLARADKLAAIDAGGLAATGRILVNSAYGPTVKALLDAAQTSVRVMVFLGTAAAGDGIDPGPLSLIESLEERAAAGVSVRVILDTDDAGVPYGSAFINRPLVDRLAPTAVEVRFDPVDTLMHSKVVVVDEQTTVLGSHNWTRVGLSETHEVSVSCESAAVAGVFAARFDGLWAALPSL